MCRADEAAGRYPPNARLPCGGRRYAFPPYRTRIGFPSRLFASFMPFRVFADKDFSHFHFPLNARTGSSRAARAAGSRLATMPVIKAVAMPATLAQVGGQAGRVG